MDFEFILLELACEPCLEKQLLAASNRFFGKLPNATRIK